MEDARWEGIGWSFRVSQTHKEDIGIDVILPVPPQHITHCFKILFLSYYFSFCVVVVLWNILFFTTTRNSKDDVDMTPSCVTV